jgi:hypothetical protein
LDEEVSAFRSFRLNRVQRMLSADGKPVRLGGRALDILAAPSAPTPVTDLPRYFLTDPSIPLQFRCNSAAPSPAIPLLDRVAEFSRQSELLQ